MHRAVIKHGCCYLYVCILCILVAGSTCPFVSSVQRASDIAIITPRKLIYRRSSVHCLVAIICLYHIHYNCIRCMTTPPSYYQRSWHTKVWTRSSIEHWLRTSDILIRFLPARRYASAGLCDSDVSVCPSVRPSVRPSVTRRYCA